MSDENINEETDFPKAHVLLTRVLLGLDVLEVKDDTIVFDSTDDLYLLEASLPMVKLRTISKGERLDDVRVSHFDEAAATCEMFTVLRNNCIEIRLFNQRIDSQDQPWVTAVRARLVVPSADSTLYTREEGHVKWKDDVRTEPIWAKQWVDVKRAMVAVSYSIPIKAPKVGEGAEAALTELVKGVYSRIAAELDRLMTVIKFTPKIKGDIRIPPRPNMRELESLLAVLGLIGDTPLGMRPVVLERHGNFDLWARIPLISGDWEASEITLELERRLIGASITRPHRNRILTGKGTDYGGQTIWVRIRETETDEIDGEKTPWWGVEDWTQQKEDDEKPKAPKGRKSAKGGRVRGGSRK